MTVVSLDEARLERTPHMSGLARCLACKHEWAAVAPLGSTWLECPSCSLEKGRYVFPMYCKGDHWECHCGNDLFQATAKGMYCPNCGQWQHGF